LNNFNKVHTFHNTNSYASSLLYVAPLSRSKL